MGTLFFDWNPTYHLKLQKPPSSSIFSPFYVEKLWFLLLYCSGNQVFLKISIFMYKVFEVSRFFKTGFDLLEKSGGTFKVLLFFTGFCSLLIGVGIQFRPNSLSQKTLSIFPNNIFLHLTFPFSIKKFISKLYSQIMQ